MEGRSLRLRGGQPRGQRDCARRVSRPSSCPSLLCVAPCSCAPCATALTRSAACAECAMSVTTTQKNTNFQSTPLQDVAKLTDVPGVGPRSAEKLQEANIDTAIKLMGNFMVRGVCCPHCCCAASKYRSLIATCCCSGRCGVLKIARGFPPPVRCCALGAAAGCAALQLTRCWLACVPAVAGLRRGKDGGLVARRVRATGAGGEEGDRGPGREG